MDRRAFTRQMPGSLIPISSSSPDVTVAFLPHPLPPAWTWPDRLWKLLLEARTGLARLDGIGKVLPNRELIITPMQTREAQLSSQLEGTITDPRQQALFEADPTSLHADTNATSDLREVFNYRQALRLGVNTQLPLSLRLIRDLHRTLLEGVRGSDLMPGEFRTTQNQIGRPARFVPPPPRYLPDALNAFETYLHADDQFDPLVRAFLAHYQFEAIHPFNDGNGRVGRLLLSLTITEWCQLSGQWLYLSPYFEKHRDRYLDRFFAVSTEGDWEAWIQFCLEGVVYQASDAEQRCSKLLALNREFQQRLKGGSVRLNNLVNTLFENPVITVSLAKRLLGVTYPTARKDLRVLENAGIVQKFAAPQIAYYCPAIFDLVYEGAALQLRRE